MVMLIVLCIVTHACAKAHRSVLLNRSARAVDPGAIAPWHAMAATRSGLAQYGIGHEDAFRTRLIYFAHGHELLHGYKFRI